MKHVTELGPEDWEKLAGGVNVPVPLVTRAILELHDQVIELQHDREGCNTRLEALKAAREHVSSLPSEQPNARGYRDCALRPGERTALELQVARYLLGGEG